MILNMRGNKVNLNQIKKELNVENDGVSAYDIIKVASMNGVNAVGYKDCCLESIKYPAIALIINQNNLQHFVVIVKILRNKVLIADPAHSTMYMNKEEFSKHYTGISIFFEGKPLFFKNIFQNKKLIILFILITLLLSLLSISFSYFMSFIIKVMEMKEKKNIIYVFLILFMFIGVIKEVINLMREKLSLKLQLLIDKVITIPILNKLICLPYEYYERNGSGTLISKVNDLSYVKEMLYMIIEVLFVNLVLILISLIFIIFINYNLLFINLFFFISFYFINKAFFNKHFYETHDLQIKNECLNNQITDCFNGILTIKNLSKEQYFSNKLSSTYGNILNLYKKLSSSYQKKEFLLSIIVIFTNISLIFFLILKNNSMSEIIFAMSLENIVISGISEIFKLQPLYADFKSSLARIEEIYKEKEIINLESSINIQNIQFKNLTYGYKKINVINKISLEINSGDWIMVTGPTGSGKSTLFKLLTKQLESVENSIYIDGVDILDLEEGVIRNSITYVDQKTRLFNKTVMENVCLKVDSILSEAANTIINDSGVKHEHVIDNINANLSGGQIQKIVIAQTLENGSNIIIFDETTNQIDVLSERKILKLIKDKYPGKTIILITHRNNNEDLFNKVITIEDGKIKNTLGRRKNETVKIK